MYTCISRCLHTHIHMCMHTCIYKCVSNAGEPLMAGAKANVGTSARGDTRPPGAQLPNHM